ncbi:hypothetical protein HZC27_04710 [Candidatus Roizmanbacteria bacterium]|nr:hypothetical protein [Candidatus Roizmanbacteria bacterium]
MGGIIDFLLSVNKISLVAFLGVLGFLIYEIILLRNERIKKQKPVLPQFNATSIVNTAVMQQQAAAAVELPKKADQVKQTKISPLLIAILILTALFFIGFTLYMVLSSAPSKKTDSNAPKIVIQEVSSPGLKIFTNSWVEVNETDSGRVLKPGVKLYIGIQTIDEADIDRARIKVNEKDWNVAHITSQFNKDKKVYYREYTVASGESKLKIDAQLHSETDGWLGD